MTRKKLKHCIILFFLALLISILVAPLRGNYISIGEITGFSLSSLVSFLLFFGATYWALQKYSNNISAILILLCLLLGMNILTAPLHIMDFESTRISFLQSFIQVLTLPLAWLCYKAKYIVKFVLILTSLLIGFWLSTNGYEMWINNISFNTCTGKLDTPKNYHLEFQSANGDTLTLANFEGKYLVVDHWYTYCSVCYKKLPNVQKLYNKYKDHPEVQVISMHSRLEKGRLLEKNSKTNNRAGETSATGKKILEDKGYNIPAYSIDIEASILKEMGVNTYPTVLIFNKESKLIFRGNIKFATKFMNETLN